MRLEALSETKLSKDEYSELLDDLFGHDNELLMNMGVKNALIALSERVYPSPTIDDFEIKLSQLPRLTLVSPEETLASAVNFGLDQYSKNDWIVADFNKFLKSDCESKRILIGHAMRKALYNLLKDAWFPYENSA